MVCVFVQRCGESSSSPSLFPFTSLFTHKMWHIKLMDRQSVFENNRKWHICLFLLGLHIRRWDTEKSETQLSETLCASCPACVRSVCTATNLYFGISKSASCLSMKDIHSIFVSQTIPRRCSISFSAASDSHSNQVCRVTEQIIQMKKKEKVKLSAKVWKRTRRITSYFVQSKF